MLTIAIMQPYLFPYIGYFQLLNAVDKFILYDNIQYMKGGWINRNRILVNGRDDYITVPLKKGSVYLHIKDRLLSDNWPKVQKDLLNKISERYRKAPHFKDVYSVIEQCLSCEKQNLFEFILNSLNLLKDYLSIRTPVIVSSTININHDLRGEQKVIEICKTLGAARYINAIGGKELYKKDHFDEAGIQLNFIKTVNVQYAQFNNEFVPNLSIIDVMMFNDKENIGKYLNERFTLE